MTISRIRLRLALSWLNSSHQGEEKLATLDQMLRPKFHPHGIRYPIEKCTAEDGMILPESAAAEWLYTEQAFERLGPWETALQRDPDGTYWLCVNFAREEDAVLFQLRWGGV